MDSKSKAKKLVKDEEKLRDICRNLDYKRDNAEIREIILALKDTMRENNLITLSAPQIGYDARIFCVKDRKENTGYRTFLDPMIEKAVGMQISREKDECFPDKEYIYPRPARIIMNYIDTRNGSYQKLEAVGFNAFAFQRMIDHFNGALNSDIGLEIDELWDQATEDERAEVIKAYMESLQAVNKDLKEEIEKDENLNKQMKAIEFVNAVAKGEVEFETEKVTKEQKEQLTSKLKETLGDKENK